MSHIEHHKYYSHILNRDVKIEVTGTYGYPVIMFPTSKGQYTQNHDFGLNDSISFLVDSGNNFIWKCYRCVTTKLLPMSPAFTN